MAVQTSAPIENKTQTSNLQASMLAFTLWGLLGELNAAFHAKTSRPFNILEVILITLKAKLAYKNFCGISMLQSLTYQGKTSFESDFIISFSFGPNFLATKTAVLT